MSSEHLQQIQIGWILIETQCVRGSIALRLLSMCVDRRERERERKETQTKTNTSHKYALDTFNRRRKIKKSSSLGFYATTSHEYEIFGQMTRRSK